jgi:hypothetical protein
VAPLDVTTMVPLLAGQMLPAGTRTGVVAVRSSILNSNCEEQLLSGPRMLTRAGYIYRFSCAKRGEEYENIREPHLVKEHVHSQITIDNESREAHS